MDIDRAMLGIILLDKIRNTVIRRRKVQHVDNLAIDLKLSWTGHVARRSTGRWALTEMVTEVWSHKSGLSDSALG